MKTYEAIILMRPLSVRLFAHFHLEQKKRKKHTHDSLTLVYGAHFPFAVCFVIMFPLPHILLLLFSLSLSLSRLLSFFLFFVSMPGHWKLLMLNVVIIIGVDQYECGKEENWLILAYSSAHLTIHLIDILTCTYFLKTLTVFFYAYILFQKKPMP